MNLSAPFVKRPIATTLLSIGVVLAGLLCFNLLPTAALPEVEYPVLLVQASLPGASPVNMASSVTSPLESSFSSIAGVTNITSNSTSGANQIILLFDLSRDINGAARDVQAAIDAAKANLPSTLTSEPTYRKVNPADSPILVLALTSQEHSVAEMFDLASSELQQKILKVDGVGQVMTVGASLPAVRVSLNLDKLNKYGISINDLNNTINENNLSVAKGKIESQSKAYEIRTNDEMFTVDEYKKLIVGVYNGEVIRLSDVAEVKQGLQNSYNFGSFNGSRSVLLVVYKSPGANVVDTNNRILSAVEEMKQDMEAGIDLQVVLNRSYTIAASISEVEFTLVAAMLFVIIVVYLFLGSIRSVIIPGVAMVATTLVTFAIMYVLGFSLNILSLMALAIATGFVVDDAIVVLENISRHIEDGMKPFDAALKGAAEIGFTVVSISSSLIAVFIPILLMPGIVGRLFEEFAVTLAVSIIISLILSLTLTPMMCAYILKPSDKIKSGSVIFDKIKEAYKKMLQWAIDHNKPMIGVLILAFFLTIYLFVISPKSFFPQQDTGRIITNMVADQNISFDALIKKMEQYTEIIQEDDAVLNVVGFINGKSNTATIFIVLKPLEERKTDIWTVINRLRNRADKIPGARIYMQAGQDLVLGGRAANAQYQFTVSANSIEDVNYYSPIIMQEIGEVVGVVDLNSDQQSNGLQSYIEIDYKKVGAYGISVNDLDNILYSLFGQNTVSTMYKTRNVYYVVSEIKDDYVQNPDLLSRVYVKSSSNQMVPLSAIAKVTSSQTILSVNHQSLFPSATLSFNLLPGANLEQVSKEIYERLGKITLPATVQYGFQGTAGASQSQGASEAVLILAAIVIVYLILGVLYESLIHPLTIISTLPSAGLGALLALYITNTNISIVALIGVILLVGIVQKNAIMMIDFVIELRKQSDLSAKEAIFKACLMRFRPILMTTMSALLGAVPMVLSSGTGSELYRPLGIAIIGGLIVSQMLTLFTTPIIYLCFERMVEKRN